MTSPARDEGAPPPRVTAGLTVTGADGVAHARSWPIPPGLADILAARWTAAFGAPSEMITTAEAAARRAEQLAAGDGIVYVTGGEVPGG